MRHPIMWKLVHNTHLLLDQFYQADSSKILSQSMISDKIFFNYFIYELIKGFHNLLSK